MTNDSSRACLVSNWKWGLASASACGWLLVVCLCAVPIQAQYRFDHWTVDNGLPHNWIKGIRQTRNGYLWLTTGSGVARFDGVRFKIFNRANTPTLSSDRFSYHTLWEDHAGILWMGTEDGGVIKYYDGIFTSLTTAAGLPGGSITRIDEDAEGAIWIFTMTGLARWKDGQLTRLAPAPGSPFNDCLVAPPQVGYDAKYLGFWRRDAAGWQRFAFGKWERFPLPPHLRDAGQLRIESIVEDSQRRVWYNLRPQNGEYYRVSDGRLTVLRGFTSSQFVCYEDRQQNLWGSDQEGRTAVWREGRRTQLTSFETPSIFQALEDQEGTLWIATLERGLYRVKRKIVTVHLHPGGPQQNGISVLTQDRTGAVWVGSGGLARLVDGRFENFYMKGVPHVPWHGLNVLVALEEERDGTFWVALRDGIARFRAGRLEQDKELSARINAIVHAIHRDRAGNLWFGSEQGLYGLRAGQLTRYGKQDGLLGESISALHEDRTGTLWIGTTSGLARWTGARFVWLGEANGHLAERVSAFYEDAVGTLWVGTQDGVLYRLVQSAAGTKVTRYAAGQGLPYEPIHQILEDDQGFFWWGARRGIYRVRKQELEAYANTQAGFITLTRIGKEDGLLSTESTSWGQPAGFKASDGKLWFPTGEGVAVIDPKDVPFNPTPPPVIIEECLLDRQPVTLGADLEIHPGQENLEINYTALSYIKSEQMRFRYRLAGYDRAWVEADTRRTAYYSHLPPGNYEFTVLAANSDGVWNTKGKSLRLVVLPPFYRTWWFLTLTSLGIVALAWLAVRYRFQQLQQRNAQQQAFARELIASQESERKRIAAELHDSLSQSLVIIKNRALLGLQTPDEAPRLTAQMEEIAESAIYVIDEVKEIAYALRPFHLDRLGLTTAIEEMLERVAESGGLRLTTRLARIDGLWPPEGEINLYRIVQESVNNAVKHAQATELRVTLTKAGRNVELQIADNGRGFDPHAARSKGNGQPRGGFGLFGIAERVRIMNGQMTIQAAPGQGVTLTIKLIVPS